MKKQDSGQNERFLVFCRNQEKYHSRMYPQNIGWGKSNASHLHIQQTNRKIIVLLARRWEDVCGVCSTNARTSSTFSAIVAVFGLPAFGAFVTLPVAKSLFTNQMMVVSAGTGVFGKSVSNASFTLFKEFDHNIPAQLKFVVPLSTWCYFFFLRMHNTLLFTQLVNTIWGSLTCYICLLGSVVSIYIG